MPRKSAVHTTATITVNSESEVFSAVGMVFLLSTNVEILFHTGGVAITVQCASPELAAAVIARLVEDEPGSTVKDVATGQELHNQYGELIALFTYPEGE